MSYHLSPSLLGCGVAVLHRQANRELLRVYRYAKRRTLLMVLISVVSFGVLLIDHSNLWAGAAAMSAPTANVLSMTGSVFFFAAVGCLLGFAAQVLFCAFMRVTCMTTVFPRTAIVMGSIIGYAALLTGVYFLFNYLKPHVTSDVLASALAGMVMAGHATLIAWALAVTVSSAADAREVWRHFARSPTRSALLAPRRDALEAAIRLSRTTTVVMAVIAVQAIAHQQGLSEVARFLALVFSLSVCRVCGYGSEADAVWHYIIDLLRDTRSATSLYGRMRKNLSEANDDEKEQSNPGGGESSSPHMKDFEA